MQKRFLPLLALLLAGCPDRIILVDDDTSSSSGSTGSPDSEPTTTGSSTGAAPTTGEVCPALSDPEAVCAAHPWERAPECTADILPCIEVIKVLADCGVDLCEYIACAEALAVAACGERPPECATLRCLAGVS